MQPTPNHLQANVTASTVFLVVAVVFLLGALVWAARSHRRDGVLPVVLIVGGLIAALQESLIDRMILLWYPGNTPAIAFTALGVHQPLYMILIYGGFVGGGTYAAYRALIADPSGRGLWRTFAGIIVMDALFEVPATAGHIFFYYGPQPFQVVPDGWALYYGFIAGAAPVLAGWGLYKLRPRVSGAGVWLLALLPPTAWATSYFAAGWPTFITVNSRAPELVRWASAAATMGLATGLVALVVTVERGARRAPVPRVDEPARQPAQPALA